MGGPAAPRSGRPEGKPRDERDHSAVPEITKRLLGPAGAAGKGPARGFLRPDRNRLAAPQDPGRLLPRGRLAHLRPPDPVCRRRHDLRRAALRHGDHRRAGLGRPGRRQRGTRPRGRPAARAAPRHQDALPGGILPIGGDQARSLPGGPAPDAEVPAGRPGAELLGQRHRDHLHPGRGRLPRFPGARAAGRRRAFPAGRGRPGGRGRGPVPPDVAGHGPDQGRRPAAAPQQRSSRGRARDPLSAGAALPGRYRADARGTGRPPARGALPAGCGGDHPMAQGGRRSLRSRPGDLRAGGRAGTRTGDAVRGALPRQSGRQADLLLPRFPA